MKELIERIVKAMVDYPDQVQINEVKAQHSIVLELRVAKADVGKVIGKRGRNANAIRDILMSVAAKDRKRVTLEIVG